MRAIESAIYTAVLRWKQGEYTGLYLLDSEIKDWMLPHIILPPLKTRDIELGRALSRGEFAKIQVGRILQYWNGRPCIIDARHIRFAQDRDADAERFEAFLDAAAKVRCLAIPLLDLHTHSVRAQAIAGYRKATGIAPVLSISMGELDRSDLSDVVRAKLELAHTQPNETAVILDLSQADFSQLAEFTPVVLDWVHKLQDIGAWRRVIVEASSYPEYNPARPNKTSLISRKEWMNWQQMVKLDSQISKYGIFGDFGADNTSIEFDGGGMPVPHLRYATQNNWFVCRGGPPHELGDGSIRQVCRWITESPYFAGEIFSWGDEAISDLAASRSDVKTASYWRSINMNHHMTMAVRDLSTLNKTKIAERTMRRTSLQQALFVE